MFFGTLSISGSGIFPLLSLHSVTGSGFPSLTLTAHTSGSLAHINPNILNSFGRPGSGVYSTASSSGFFRTGKY